MRHRRAWCSGVELAEDATGSLVLYKLAGLT
jgi:hypothetical protein